MMGRIPTADRDVQRIDIIGESHIRPGETDQAPDTRVLVQTAGDIVLRLSVGKRANLDRWLAPSEYGETVDAEPAAPATVCGTSAQRQVARRRVAARRVHTGAGKRKRGGSDRTAVAVFLSHSDQDVLVEWSVPTQSRAAFKAAEAHYFGSLVCL